jgi:hypothetical protein
MIKEVSFLYLVSKHTKQNTNLYTYHFRSIPEGVAEASQILLQDAHVLPKLLSYEELCRRDRWYKPIAI